MSSDSDSECDYNNGEYINQVSSCCYIYKNKQLDDDYYISITNYSVYYTEDIDVLISNYYICDNKKDDINIFASVIWEDIDYKDNNYDPYDYDPDPIAILYRDDWETKKVDKYLYLINKLGKEFYEPTTYYKHFNPDLPKIALSKFTDKKYAHIEKEFRNIMLEFNKEK